MGSFTAENALSLEILSAAAKARRLQELLLPLDAAVAHLDRVDLAVDQSQRLAQGQFVPAPAVADQEPRRAYASDGRFLAIVRYDAQRQAWRPIKVFA